MDTRKRFPNLANALKVMFVKLFIWLICLLHHSNTVDVISCTYF
jgi:hypothetical protein